MTMSLLICLLDLNNYIYKRFGKSETKWLAHEAVDIENLKHVTEDRGSFTLTDGIILEFVMTSKSI